MNKCHTPITWVNDQTPAINDTHLNQYDGELDTLDDRVITLDTTKAAQSDLLLAFKDVSLNSSTGVITFTLFNNTTKTIDTLLEKIAVNFDYDDDPTSAHYQNLIITLEDGTVKYIDMSALITEYEFTDSSTIDFTVTSGAVSASVIDGSITATKCDPTFALAISDAEANGLKSEGYANGTQNGTPVSSGSPYYENNAKYWRDQAHAIVSNSLAGLDDVTITTPAKNDVLLYDGSSDWVNKKLILPHIIVISETGSTVTFTKGGTTIMATETSTGHFEADVDEFGTWTIDSVLGGDDAQISLLVDAVKVYTVDDSHIYADITVTYSSGAQVSCSRPGDATLYATASPYVFTVHATGIWTITAVYPEGTLSDSVLISSSGQTESFDFSTTTPKGIQRIVRAGLAENFFDIGDQIEVTYKATNNTEYSMPFDVVHFDTVELADGTTHPGMFLQSHYTTLEDIQFDAPEPNNTLGTGGVKDNDIAAGGYDRWSESGVRAWLNSTSVVNGWWGSSFERGGATILRRAADVAPSQLSSINGFLKGLPDDFVSVLGTIKVQSTTNTITDSGVTDTTYDKIFLPSMEQIYCEPEVSGIEGVYWEYWKESLGLSSPAQEYPNTYLAYNPYSLEDHSSTQPIFLRTAGRNRRSYSVISIGLPGAYVSGRAASAQARVKPACVIV